LSLVISIVGIIWLKEIGQALSYLTQGYTYLSEALGVVIRGGYAASIANRSLTLVLVPIIVAFIPGGLYWLMKRSVMPYIYDIIYAIWLIMLTTLALYR